jgi:hypothetical protein
MARKNMSVGHGNIVPYGMRYIIFEEFFMNFLRKKTVIIAAALLLVIGAGTAFAAVAAGISVTWSKNTVTVTNSNKQAYNVTVKITYKDKANAPSQQTTKTVNVKAGKKEGVSLAATAVVERAEITDTAVGL